MITGFFLFKLVFIYPLFGIQKHVKQGSESVLKGHWKGVGRTLEGPCDDLGPSNPLPMPL